MEILLLYLYAVFLTSVIASRHVTLRGRSDWSSMIGPADVCRMRTGDVFLLTGWICECPSEGFTEIPQFYSGCLSLDLSHNNLEVIPNHVFTRASVLLILDLSTNIINTLEPMAFDGLMELIKLDLTGNHLKMTQSTYTEKLFSNLGNLKTLYMSRNIQIVDPSYHYPLNALSKLTSLEELMIDGLTNATFSSDTVILFNLTTLKMGYYYGFICQIKHINRDFFKSIPNLRNITLRDCNIQSIHPATFAHVRTVGHLDISGLGLDVLTTSFYPFRGSTTLVLLKLSKITGRYDVGVMLGRQHVSWMTNTTLRSIDVGANTIEALEPGVLELLPKGLQYLFMSYNRLLPSQAAYLQFSSLKSLIYIDASRSLMKRDYLDFAYGVIPKLEICDYSYNGALNWVSLQPMETLSMLDLSGNQCSSVSVSFFDVVKRLKRLHLSHNLMGIVLSIPEHRAIFSELRYLEMIDLGVNNIRDVHNDIFINQTKMKTILLNGNTITEINIEISHMKSLQFISLKRNRISTIPAFVRRTLGMFGSGFRLDITGNSPECSCKNIDYIHWLTNTRVNVSYDHIVECTLPNGTTVQSDIGNILLALELNCATFSLIIAIGVICNTMAIIAILIGMIYKERLKLQYLYNLFRSKYYDYDSLALPEYKWDVFISYAAEDYQFIFRKIIPILEEDRGLKLCLHQRDFMPGEAIASNILNAINNSRRTVVILSRDYVRSSWCRYEFNMAKMEGIYSDRNVVILVEYSFVPESLIPMEMKEHRELDTYITYTEGFGEHMFWQRLYECIQPQKQEKLMALPCKQTQ